MTGSFNVDRFFDQFGDTRKQASVDAVFGAPIEAGDKTLIPIGTALYGFGLGVGANDNESQTQSNVGGGGGGGYAVHPVAMAVIDSGAVRIDPIVRPDRIAIGGILFGAWTVFWMGRVLLRLVSRKK